MRDNIILIGFMGTGKTVVGRRLASRLQKNFIDTDAEIERVTGMSIPQLIKKHGYVRFRSEGNLALKRISNVKNAVIAAGGGIVLNDENMKLLKQLGTVICLKASPEAIKERTERRTNKPFLDKGDYNEIKKMLAEREKYYRQADFTLDTTDLSIEEVLEKITEYLREAS